MTDETTDARVAGAMGQEAGRYPVGKPYGVQSVAAAVEQTVLDRQIQQSLLQVLQGIFEPTFSASS